MKAGWRKVSLGTMCDVIAGQSPAGSAYNDKGVGLPFYQGKKEFSDRFLGTPTTWTTKITKEALAGDILMSVRAPVGPINEATQKICIGRGLAAIRPKGEIIREFLWYSLLWLQPTIKGNSGAVFESINKAAIEALSVALPPLEEQRRIVAILDEAFEGLSRARANAEANLQSARELFESFLASEFSGNVSSWETCPLAEHVMFIDYRGKTPPKTEHGIRLITAKNVKMGFIQREPEEFILESAYKTWMTRGFPKKGDVLFTTEAPLANVAQLDVDETVVIGQRLITMQPNEKVILPSFLKFSLMSPPIQKEIHARGTGATVLGIKASLLKTVPISFPRNLKEQRIVAARCQEVYDIANQLAEKFEAKAYELDQLRQSLLQKAFAGELTVKEFA